MKKIVILGSTGSIGTQTLAIVREQDDIEVTALCAGANVRLLEQQIREFHPLAVALWKEEDAKALRESVKDLNVTVYSGMEGLLEVVQLPNYEICVTAMVGMLGIRPTIAAICAKKTIALANKETLVTAGHLIMPLAREHGVSILPVDSEHSAIFQALQGAGENPVTRILLTASGGPFRGRNSEELEQVTLEDALRHPNWSMGKKITVDSATMVNKGLEVIEAKWLFAVNLSQIEVIVHPESIIHSMIEYEDGGVIAQLGTPDMRLPIAYALNYPKRHSLSGKRLDFYELASVHFEKPDTEVFYGLRLAYDAANRGGNMPTIYNAANEKAVALFLAGKIRFFEIPALIEGAMAHCSYRENPDLSEILETELESHEWVAIHGNGI
ncbi:1-deoxy-D-xylulose 5-phosphate reductoisomerase 2 [Clostridia bacterium]|nr:1-deoxy-D-xylulose 5-phosphate reductoisomerase 2 [Clostridia bacterium]